MNLTEKGRQTKEMTRSPKQYNKRKERVSNSVNSDAYAFLWSNDTRSETFLWLNFSEILWTRICVQKQWTTNSSSFTADKGKDIHTSLIHILLVY